MVIPDRWTPIAWSAGRGEWIASIDAVMTVREARFLYDAGELLMAQRRESTRVMSLLVKRAKKRKPCDFFGSAVPLVDGSVKRTYGRCEV